MTRQHGFTTATTIPAVVKKMAAQILQGQTLISTSSVAAYRRYAFFVELTDNGNYNSLSANYFTEVFDMKKRTKDAPKTSRQGQHR